MVIVINPTLYSSSLKFEEIFIGACFFLTTLVVVLSITARFKPQSQRLEQLSDIATDQCWKFSTEENYENFEFDNVQ